MAPTPHRSLRVVLVWHGEPFEERFYSEPKEIRLGSDPGDDFAAPESVRGASYPIFRGGPAGFTLALAQGLHGKVHVGGTKRTVIGDLAATEDLAIAPGDWGILGLDPNAELAIFFQFVEGAPALTPPATFLDRYVGQAVGLSALVHASLLVLAFCVWQPEHSLEVDPPPTLAMAKVLLDRQHEKQDPERDRAGGERRAREPDASKRAAGKEGKIGAPDAKTAETKIPKGPRDQIAAKVSQLGLLGTLKQRGRSEALTQLLSDNADAQMTTALAGIKGAQLQVGRGSGGLATRGTGPGGGGEGPGQILGVGNLAVGGGGHGRSGAGIGTGHGAKEVKVSVTTGTPSTEGGLSRDQVNKVVLSHQAAIRFCYEKELQRLPHLSGNVNLSWKIDTDGRVQAARIESTTLGNPAAEGCMVRQLKAWQFPKSNGMTIVTTYPFIFRGN